MPRLHDASTEDARLAAAVYRASIGAHRHADQDTRRQILTLDAARFNAKALLDALNARAAAQAWLPLRATAGTLCSGQRNMNTLTGHTDRVSAVACTELDGRPIAVTGSHDETVRVWDLGSGQPVGQPLTGHTQAVRAVACTVLDGRPVAVTGSHDETVRIWDLSEGSLKREIHLPAYCNALSIRENGLLICANGPDVAVFTRMPER